MKSKYYLCLFLLAALASCKRGTGVQSEIGHLNVSISETELSYKSDSIDLTRLSNLTQAQYDSLQLNKIADLKNCDLGNIVMGKLLLSNANGKILTIQAITDGEISEYLLSYDKNGDLVDELLVAYEDMVEYYNDISSKIKGDKITVQAIRYTYLEDNDNPLEQSDTTITWYHITPDLKFVKE